MVVKYITSKAPTMYNRDLYLRQQPPQGNRRSRMAPLPQIGRQQRLGLAPRHRLGQTSGLGSFASSQEIHPFLQPNSAAADMGNMMATNDDINEMRSQITQLDQQVCQLSQQVGQLGQQLGQVDRDVQNVRQEFPDQADIKKQLQEIGNRLTQLVDGYPLADQEAIDPNFTFTSLPSA